MVIKIRKTYTKHKGKSYNKTLNEFDEKLDTKFRFDKTKSKKNKLISKVHGGSKKVKVKAI